MTLIEQVILLYPIYIIIIYYIISKEVTKRNEKKWDNNSKLDELEKTVDRLLEKLKAVEEDLGEEIEVREETVVQTDEKIEVLDKKIDREISGLKLEIKKVDESLEVRIDRKVKELIQEKTYLSSLEKELLNIQLIKDNERRMFDLDIFDKKISRIMNDVIGLYFKNAYFGNPSSYDLNTGIYRLPDITQATKKKDIEEIYARFMNVVNKNFLINDLSLIYDMEQVETKVFLIERYVINEYTARIEKMIEEWQDKQKEMADEMTSKRLDDERRKAIRKAEEERKNSEIGKLESMIDEVYNNIE